MSVVRVTNEYIAVATITAASDPKIEQVVRLKVQITQNPIHDTYAGQLARLNSYTGLWSTSVGEPSEGLVGEETTALVILAA